MRSVPVTLLKKYISGNCSPEEIETVENWFSSFDGMPETIAGLSPEERKLLEEHLFGKIMMAIDQIAIAGTSQQKTKTVFLWKKIAIAASLILCMSIGYLYYKQPEAIHQSPAATAAVNDAAPGGNKAVLQLSDGSSITLTDGNSGEVAKEQDIAITKTGKGQLTYLLTDNASSAHIAYNTISTPVGGQYQVQLPDGSKIWLNSKSSVRFPTRFTGSERKVEMTGEVYFEVAKNAKMPFHVIAGETEIKVLGTHFNVMAYQDERIKKTTLLEGSINISNQHSSQRLLPGQQAQLSNNILEVKDKVDIERIMAWKNGVFNFKNMNIRDIMRQASRWYDIEVNFEGNASNLSYTGTISKDVNLSEMLSMLQFTGLNYQLQGKRLTIKN